MILRSGLVISIVLLLLTISFRTQAQDQNCRKIDHTVDIKDSKNGQSNGSITVKAKRSSESFRLHLLGKGNGRGSKDNQLDITSGRVENIAPGTYDLVIHYENAEFCSETRKVIIN